MDFQIKSFKSEIFPHDEYWLLSVLCSYQFSPCCTAHIMVIGFMLISFWSWPNYHGWSLFLTPLTCGSKLGWHTLLSSKLTMMQSTLGLQQPHTPAPAPCASDTQVLNRAHGSITWGCVSDFETPALCPVGIALPLQVSSTHVTRWWAPTACAKLISECVPLPTTSCPAANRAQE